MDWKSILGEIKSKDQLAWIEIKSRTLPVVGKVGRIGDSVVEIVHEGEPTFVNVDFIQLIKPVEQSEGDFCPGK